MIRFASVIFCFLLICCSPKEPIPNEVFPVKKMQAVLWDVMRADEIANYYKAKDSTIDLLSKHIQLYDTIFSIHKVTKEDFKRSLQFYQSRPDLLKIILDSLQKKGGNNYGQKIAP